MSSKARTPTGYDGNFDRLPKWAQSHIDSLERKIRELQREVDGAAVAGGRVQTLDVRGSDYLYRPIERDTAYFEVIPGRRLQAQILDGDDFAVPRLRIHGDDCYVIRPTSANGCEILPYEMRSKTLVEWDPREDRHKFSNEGG